MIFWLVATLIYFNHGRTPSSLMIESHRGLGLDER